MCYSHSILSLQRQEWWGVGAGHLRGCFSSSQGLRDEHRDIRKKKDNLHEMLLNGQVMRLEPYHLVRLLVSECLETRTRHQAKPFKSYRDLNREVSEKSAPWHHQTLLTAAIEKEREKGKTSLF